MRTSQGLRLALYVASVAGITLANAGGVHNSQKQPIEITYVNELQSVRDLTRDPEAVQFRKLHIGAENTLCGEMNAKNAYGGYIGYKPFYVQSGQTTIVTDEGRELRRDLSDAQWAWERKLDADNYVKLCGATP